MEKHFVLFMSVDQSLCIHKFLPVHWLQMKYSVEKSVYWFARILLQYLKKEPLFLLASLQCNLPVPFKSTYCKDFGVSIQVLFYQ